MITNALSCNIRCFYLEWSLSMILMHCHALSDSFIWNGHTKWSWCIIEYFHWPCSFCRCELSMFDFLVGIHESHHSNEHQCIVMHSQVFPLNPFLIGSSSDLYGVSFQDVIGGLMRRSGMHRSMGTGIGWSCVFNRFSGNSVWFDDFGLEWFAIDLIVSVFLVERTRCSGRSLTNNVWSLGNVSGSGDRIDFRLYFEGLEYFMSMMFFECFQNASEDIPEEIHSKRYSFCFQWIGSHFWMILNVLCRMLLNGSQWSGR